ncbi:TolB-like 6-bladed beta-propeller domain-containing protein [Algoriphagus halophytocola]|uniref:TolB-like 6-bladed beta-propeller domain-containing protein n=1 Tax=Algoriphagus halophytocola TaxID=2991499 RepID=A0ABY6MBX0_9BACT|nr:MULTISPECIES: TolB-like 6-bladed beta-propeller domain-containing protein [unclassified Algoriphagus]UZD21090.1 TolB-like 6-bladed beta-propeller domain-containing protein [Algoriphagus sp. TR-M5]WBL42256.1 TolB-like 6-bladed beta-propeller domain-containing protein [Algoriphagus sp. TR-M9]
MKNKLLFVFGVFSGLLFLYSCNSEIERIDPIQEFKNTEPVSSYRLQASDSLFKVVDLLSIGDVLIAYDDEMDYLYKIFDVEQDKFLKKFGKFGQGPCELSGFSFMVRTGEKGEKLGLFERQTREFQEFYLEQVLEYDEDPECIPFEGKFDFEIRSVVKVGENKFVGATLGDKPYTLLEGGKMKGSIGEYPYSSDFKGVNPMVLALAYQFRLIKHPSKPIILSTSTFSYNMDILEAKDGNNLVINRSLHFWPPEFRSMETASETAAPIGKENRFGNIRTSVSENFIYVLYSDEPWEYQFPLKSDRVLVYDWDGNPVKILELDQEVSIIAVPDNDQYLIGYLDDGKANLYRFELD